MRAREGKARRRGTPGALWHGLLPLALGAWLVLCAGVLAADFPEGIDGPLPPSAPRFFPRGDGDDSPGAVPLPRRLHAGCPARRGYVPTNDPDDPSYVGSAYGLGKPSYYGFRPALGHDDPFGRPLRDCP